ncbi:precorrin-6A reductase [Intestinibacillus massiliensis]|uniref:precorrin-6A reductase n=1 Tax=Intestinibacillus massiliensis TaxID=1871029 RepID=UPI000B3594C4|nr:precorrin-6A reductase [Intestinibacillus massiliensis]
MSILVFAGTSEGRKLAEFLSAGGLAADIYVATEYGELSLPVLPAVTVHRGRLTTEQMEACMAPGVLVIDATHPYADVVTANIRQACSARGAEYIRLLRPQVASGQPVVTVPDAQAAAAYLNTVTGAALLTTGSKELKAFTTVHRFAERLYPRVLPTAEVLQKCAELGFSGRSIIAMQGPFSHELNVALLRQTRAKYLVAKDSGAAGGFAEKLSAAKETGATVLLIARPTKEEGLTLEEVEALLRARFPMARLAAASRFPLFISLVGRRVLVAGAGRIAARRILVLQRFGADITVVSPECAVEIDCGTIRYFGRSYEKSDLSGAFLVIAATNDRLVNARIAQDCREAGILCSVADSASESTFFFPAVCTAGKLTAGVVSDGSDHSATARAAAQIRAILQEGTDAGD